MQYFIKNVEGDVKMNLNLNSTLKVEDTVYSIKKGRKIIEFTIKEIIIVNGHTSYICDKSNKFTLKDVNKRIFVKKEDAENLLKKLYSGLLSDS